MLQRTAGVVRTRTSQVAHGLGSTPVGRDPGVRRFVRSRLNWFFVAVALILLAVASVGVLPPLTLSKLKFDPAVSSAVFVTATTDFFGFLIFLGLATIVLL